MKKVCIVILCMLVMSGWSLMSAQNKLPGKMKPALLVIDMQNGFLPYMSEQDKKTAMEMIPYLIQMFRQYGFPIIRIYHHEPGSEIKPGSDAFEFPKTIPVTNDDVKVIKNYGNGFKKTELGKILRDKGCNTLFLCGLSATGCVLATYHGAMDNDFNAFMIKNSLISDDTALTKAVQEICQTIDFSALRLLLDNVQK